MIFNETICALIQEQHITITLAPLPKRIQGFYSHSSRNPQIVINDRFPEWGSKYRSVLAEELGHHFTSSGEALPRSGMPYYDRIQHDRSELKAVRWAADFLIPTELLLRRIEDCSVSCIQELADAFLVTVELIQLKLYYMSCKALYWPLKDESSLCLSSLPSIYIYNPFTDGIP
jgi:Zn-dependent peptidase ImmA (M78 family)